MRTWDDYKNHIKSISTEDKKDMEEIEELATIVGTMIERRNELGLSQRDLAAMCNIPQSSVARIESCRTTPKIDTLLKIFGQLGLQFSVTPAKPF